MLVYFVDFFQYQWTNPSALVLDVDLTELVLVCHDGADFLDRVLVAYPVKEVVNPIRRRRLERIVRIDFHHLAIPRKYYGKQRDRWSIRWVHITYSLQSPSILSL